MWFALDENVAWLAVMAAWFLGCDGCGGCEDAVIRLVRGQSNNPLTLDLPSIIPTCLWCLLLLVSPGQPYFSFHHPSISGHA